MVAARLGNQDISYNLGFVEIGKVLIVVMSMNVRCQIKRLRALYTAVVGHPSA